MNLAVPKELPATLLRQKKLPQKSSIWRVIPNNPERNAYKHAVPVLIYIPKVKTA